MRPLACIIFAEAGSAPEVTWSLVDAGYDVIAIGRRGRRCALRHSSLARVVDITPPERDCAAALDETKKILSKYAARPGPRALFPLDDSAVWVCGQLPPDDWTLVGPHGHAADVALNKAIQVEHATAAGFNVPRTTIATTADEVRARAGELPLVLRPADAILPGGNRLGKGRNWICADRGELEKALASWRSAWPLMVQPFVHGKGEGVFGLVTEGRVQAWSAHRRVRMMNPHGSGSSACAAQPVPAGIKRAVEKFVELSAWNGLFMVELIRDAGGQLWFVEFNGRPWGSMALSRRQGLEYPAWAADQALQRPATREREPDPERPLVCRNAGREFMHLLFVLRGPQSTAIKEWPSFWRSARDILFVGSRSRFYNWRRGDLKVFIFDWWYTVMDHVRKSHH